MGSKVTIWSCRHDIHWLVLHGGIVRLCGVYVCVCVHACVRLCVYLCACVFQCLRACVECAHASMPRVSCAHVKVNLHIYVQCHVVCMAVID